MRRPIRIALFAFAAVVVLGALAVAAYVIYENQTYASQNAELAGTPITGVNTVTLTNSTIAPANISVPVGTTVTWTNADEVRHNVTFKARSGPASSGLIAKGETFSATFDVPGVYEYTCTIHPEMIGRVTVTPR